MSRSERDLVTATEISNLRSLDEDALIALHDRVRRARNKHVQLHRREVGQQVAASGSRGVASLAPRRSASKAEVFEMALARVSTALAKRARESAAELRAERLASARSSAGDGRGRASTAARDRDVGQKTRASSRSRGRSPVERKTVAASRAAGDRRQAKRDAR
jgi:hypothetical protein